MPAAMGDNEELSAWPTEVFGFAVTKRPIGSGVALSHPVVGVLHTTEGSAAAGGDERAWHTLSVNADPPHFVVDTDSIIQTRSLDETAAALRHSPELNPEYPGATNAFAVQIEIAGSSAEDPWMPPAATLDRVVALVAYMSRYHDIPLVVPNPEWKDDISDTPLPWAKRNPRRIWSETHFPNARGWYMHMEVPGQAPKWHWDCGAIGRTEILQRAAELIEGDSMWIEDVGLDNDTVNHALNLLAGMYRRMADSPVRPDEPQARRFGFTVMDDILTIRSDLDFIKAKLEARRDPSGDPALGRPLGGGT